MNCLLATITARRGRSSGPAAQLFETYLSRSETFCPTSQRSFPTESSLMEFLDKAAARTRPALLLADSRGDLLTSEDFAREVGRRRDSGTQQLVFAIGPADGWSPAARQRADRLVSFGRITLPHELAAVIAAEQLYRALTILAGHPYHGGH